MRVALLIEKFAARGGAERMCGYVADGLQSRGHEVHVFAMDFGETDVVKHEIAKGSHTQFAKRCAEAVGSFDVVHSFTRTLKHDILRLGGGIHAEYLKRVEPARSPLNRLWSKINPKERAILDLERNGLQEAHTIQAVSHRVKQETIEHYGVDANKIVVMHNGVDTKRFNPNLRGHRDAVLDELKIPRDAFVSLFVGSGARRKGLKDAVTHGGGAHLIVVGEGEAGANPMVHYAGRRSDVERFYGAADVLVLPTLYDPFPNVCMEAMASGVPVIVTRVAGPSEIMTDGVEGFVIDDAYDIADRIRRITPEMRKAARALAEKHPIERYIDDTVSLYERVALR